MTVGVDQAIKDQIEEICKSGKVANASSLTQWALIEFFTNHPELMPPKKEANKIKAESIIESKNDTV